MSATVAVRATHFRAGDRFDERLGAGSLGPHQAAEETDLLLRLLAQGAKAELHPDIIIRGKDSTRRMPLRQQISKTWGYSRAHTHVLRRYDTPAPTLLRALVRPLGRAVFDFLRLDLRQSVLALTRFLGRLRGVFPA
jgi:hypothetical protein